MSNKIVKDAGVHHIALKVRDYDLSLKFYAEGLGFEQLLEWGEGNSRICLMDIGDGVCLELFAGGAESQPTGAFIHLAIRTSDTDSAYAAALAAGAKPDKPPFEARLCGRQYTQPARIAFVIGPDGENLEFFCPREIER